MLNNKILILTLITGLLAAPAAADLEFRDPNDVKFYTGIQMNNNEITGLPDPGTDSSPMTKGYADLNYLNRNGATLEGRLNANGNNITGLPTPQSSSDAVPKSYVDSETSGNQNFSQVLNKDNTATTSINMSGNKIINLPTPTASTEPVTRGYALSNFVRDNGDSINGSIDLLGTNDIIAPDEIRTGGQNIQIRDTNNGQDIARLKEGGNIEIPNGGLNISNNYENSDTRMLSIRPSDSSVKDWRIIYRGNENLRLWDNENKDSVIDFKRGGNIEIPSGNLDLSGNQLVNPSRIEYMDNDGDGNSWIGREYSTDGSFRFYDDTNVNLIMRQNGNMEIPNGKLTVNNPGNGDIIDASATNAKFLVTEASTSTYWATHNITDNGYDIGTNSESRSINIQPGGSNTLIANPGGNVEIPNGNLQTNSNDVNLQGGDLRSSSEVCAGDQCS